MLLSGDASYSYYDITSIEGELKQDSRISGFNGGLDFTYFLRKADELKFGLEAITYSTDFEVDPAVGIRELIFATNTPQTDLSLSPACGCITMAVRLKLVLNRASEPSIISMNGCA